MPNKSLAPAVLQGKCPRCRTGEMFSSPAYNIRRFADMNEVCPWCGVRLEPEPGFYQGAMYVGYAFSVAVIVGVGILLYFLAGDPNEWIYVGTVIAITFLIAPLNYRFSRILYLYWFGGLKYDAKLSR